MSNHPYPGLRPFRRDESDIFFGRDDHSDALLDTLRHSRFVAVLGPSGCGKSSLVRVGLLGGLEAGFLGAGEWWIADMRPGDRPFDNLVDALLADAGFRAAYVGEDAPLAKAAQVLAKRLNESTFGLHEIIAALPPSVSPPLEKGGQGGFSNPRLLLLVDQFEELFRYFDQGNSDAARRFVALLLASAKHARIYVCLTMRSDFLGDCARFRDLPEAINQGLYLTPRLSREALREAIAGPLGLFDADMEPALLTRLLNDAEDKPDQLPVVQHALMRLWLKIFAPEGGGQDGDFRRAKILMVKDYEGIGGLGEALSLHADEAWGELSVERQRVAEILFRALCERGAGRDTRRPARLGAVAAIAGVDWRKVAAVVEVFRAPGRFFLLPPQPRELGPETVLDIVHESLIRQWRRLQTWVAAEAADGETYRRLEDSAVLWQRGDAALVQEPELSRLLAWRADFQPSSAWASRYGRDDIQTAARVALVPKLQLGNPDPEAPASRPREAGASRAGVPKLALGNEQNEQNPEAPASRPREAGASRTGIPKLELGNEQKGASLRASVPPCENFFDLAQTYLDTSHAAHRARRRRTVIFRALAAALATLLVAAGFWVQQREAAQQRAHAAQVAKLEQQRTAELFDSRLTHASLLAQGEDYARAREVLQHSATLDDSIPAPRRHARNLLAGYVNIFGGEAAQVYEGAGASLTGNVVLSPDGRHLAVGGEKATLVIFAVANGKLLQRLAGHDPEAGQAGVVWALVFDPQGRLYSAGDDSQILRWVWENDSYRQDAVWQAPAKVYALALSPDGAWLASGGTDNNISLWNTASGEVRRTLEGHKGMIGNGGGLAFSPDGKRLASASYDDSAARLWDVERALSGEEDALLHVLRAHNDGVHSVAFSPDGKRLATGSLDKMVLLWDTARGRPVQVYRGHQNYVFGLAFSPDGRQLASAGNDRTLRLWDTDSGVTLRVFQGHQAGATDLTWRGARLYSAANDGTVRAWDTALAGQRLVDLPGEPTPAALAPDNAWVAVGFADGSLRAYATADGRLLWEMAEAHEGRVVRLAFAPDGAWLASAGLDDHTVKLWRLKESNPGIGRKNTRPSPGLDSFKKFTVHTAAVHAVAFSANSHWLASAGYDGQVGLFRVDDEEQQVFSAHQGKVASVAFTHDANHLLSAGIDDSTLRLWNLTTTPPSLQQELLKAPQALLWAALSPDARWAVAVGRNSLLQLQPLPGNPAAPRALVGHEQAVFRAVFSPDSAQLATVSADATLRLWDVAQAAPLFSLRLPTNVSPPTPLWDFDFHCHAGECRAAVPLTRGKLALYRFAYKTFAEAKVLNEGKQAVAASYRRGVEIRLQAGDVRGALQTAREGLAYARAWGTQPALAQARLGDVYRVQEDFAAALAAYEAALASDNIPSREVIADSEVIMIHYHRGQIYQAQEQPAAAAEAYRAAMTAATTRFEAHPDDAQRLNDLTALVNLLSETAERRADKAHLSTPSSATAEVSVTPEAPPKADDAALIRPTGEGLALYTRLLKNHPEHHRLRGQRLQFAARHGETALVEADVQALLASEDAAVLNGAGYTLAETTEYYEPARLLVARALELQPDAVHIQDSMGWVLYKLARYEEALEYLRKAAAQVAEWDPSEYNYAEIVTHLGEVLWVSGDQEKAKQVWAKARADFPEDEYLRETLARFGQQI